jgi:hypothetical protein
LGVGWGVQHLPPSLNGLKEIEIKKKKEQQTANKKLYRM